MRQKLLSRENFRLKTLHENHLAQDLFCICLVSILKLQRRHLRIRRNQWVTILCLLRKNKTSRAFSLLRLKDLINV